jgi:hypothetical protein
MSSFDGFKFLDGRDRSGVSSLVSSNRTRLFRNILLFVLLPNVERLEVFSSEDFSFLTLNRMRESRFLEAT